MVVTRRLCDWDSGLVVEYEDSARTGRDLRESREFANTFQLSVTEGLVNTLGAIVMQTLKTVLSYSLEDIR